MVKVRVIAALIIVLLCIPSLHYSYAQPAPEPQKSDMISSPTEPESQDQQDQQQPEPAQPEKKTSDQPREENWSDDE